jgi:hypothetical protein
VCYVTRKGCVAPSHQAGAFVMSGEAMPTLAELDEALMHASLVPESDRGKAWHAWTDSLLEQRNRILTLEPVA